MTQCSHYTPYLDKASHVTFQISNPMNSSLSLETTSNICSFVQPLNAHTHFTSFTSHSYEIDLFMKVYGFYFYCFFCVQMNCSGFILYSAHVTLR